MDHMGSPPLHPADHASSSTKRKRSPSTDPPGLPTPPAKTSKNHSHHLHINYLARQFSEILPLISAEHDSLPSLLTLIGDYEGVLHRHESMAGNLGARPLGPILIQRFERLFDGPPRVLKMNGKESTSVGWLDVVEFARSKPEQFKLEQTREGVKVCQFYTKQCRVEISEEDFVLVRSGMPQKLIPPQPIAEDEEKELGTLEILEKTLGNCVHLADQVAGRARQLNHKIRSRRNAILSRREVEATSNDDVPRSSNSRDLSHSRHPSNGDRASNSPTGGGFVPVNRYANTSDRLQYNGSSNERPRSNGPVTNGSAPLHGASAATRAELLSKFHTTSERSSTSDADHSHRLNSISRSSVPSKPNSRAYADSMEYAGVLLNTASPVPIPNTPTSLLPYVKPSPADRFDDSGPYKADMMARMEQLNRGDRVQPPCDRCRRLHMDCLKNLTACMGCTKKHAKCSWKDVEEQELKDHPFVLRVKTADEMALEGSEGEGSRSGASRNGGETRTKKQKSMEVRDEELLGEDSGDEDVESKDRPALEPFPKLDSSNDIPTVNRSPVAEAHQGDRGPKSADATSPSTEAYLGALKTKRASLSRQLSPEPTKESYQAPQVQMQRYPVDETDVATITNGHVQTEYEKDIYSQLNEATRSGAEGDKSAATNTPHEEPVRVYTASSEPSEPSILPVVPPMQLDPIHQESVTNSPSIDVQYQQQQVAPTHLSTPQQKEPTSPPRPQMPSPPPSGVPSQATPTPVTPVLEQAITG